MTKDFVPAPVPESHGLSPRTSHPPPPEDGIHLDGLARVVVSDVSPEVDGGRSAAKRVLGDTVTVEVDLVVDGHERVAGCVRYRKAGDDRWREAPLTPLVNDRWEGRFTPDAIGLWEYTVEAWHDIFGGWRAFVEKRLAAGQDPELDLLAGQDLLRDAAARAHGADREALERYASALGPALPIEARTAVALSPRLAALMFLARRPRPRLALPAGAPAARRPAAGALLDLVRDLPPLGGQGRRARHAARPRGAPPVHRVDGLRRAVPAAHPPHRSRAPQGRNNTLVAEQGDPGALGHRRPRGRPRRRAPRARHLELRAPRRDREAHGMEVAMDIAFRPRPTTRG
ncbi:MAG: maltotransferase domain-containing protein [Polyangiales bacterium]